MKPETASYLQRAQRALTVAEYVLSVAPERAGREAYYAAFHAAQALFFERTDKSSKSHSGVRSRFAAIVRDDPSAHEFTRFLGTAYAFKDVADYDITGREVTQEEAKHAIGIATRFVAYVTALLTPGES